MTSKLEFETNVPVAVMFPFGGQPKDPEPSEYGSYYYGVEVEGKRMGLYAPEALHKTILQAGIERGGEARITKCSMLRCRGKIAVKDGKQRTVMAWRVEYGGDTFFSNGPEASRSATRGGKLSVLPWDKSPADGPARENGHTKPPLDFREACRELACLYYNCGLMAAWTSALLGEPVSATVFFIELRRMGQRPDEEAMQEWAAIRPEDPPEPEGETSAEKSDGRG